MFEAAELGRTVSKTEFDEREPELHLNLLDVQRRPGTALLLVCRQLLTPAVDYLKA